MSLDRRAEFEALARKAQDDANEIMAGLAAGLMLPIAWIIARSAYFLSNAPGRDVTFDNDFSISDIIRVVQFCFCEPAYIVLGFVPAAFWDFFEIDWYAVPGFVLFVVASACWIVIAIIIFQAGRYLAKGFGAAGRGMTFGIGRVQVRFPKLMGMDIVLIVVGLVVFGGFALAMLVNSMGGRL